MGGVCGQFPVWGNDGLIKLKVVLLYVTRLFTGFENLTRDIRCGVSYKCGLGDCWFHHNLVDVWVPV